MTIDKLLIGLFSDRTLSIVESHTNLSPADALPDSRAGPGDHRREQNQKPLDGPSHRALPFANFGGDPRSKDSFATGS